MNFKVLAKNGLNFIQKNQSTILTGLGVAGLVSTAVLTAQATYKATRTIHDEGFEVEELTVKERFLLTWRMYIPPVLMGGVSIACILGAHSANSKKNAALAGLYAITEDTLQDYRQKVKEKLGEKKEEEVYAEVAQEKLNKNPVSKNEIFLTGKGETLVYDSSSGRYFKSDIETIRKAANDLNQEMLFGFQWMALNDFYCALGLGAIKMGEELGWTPDNLIDIKFDTMIADNGEPCLVINLNARPR